MNLNSKIYVAGHTGLVGSALMRALAKKGYLNIIVKDYTELDLTRQIDVESFFEREKPEYVFLAAAKVGGIYANNAYPADFIYINLQIETNVIHSACKFGVRKLLLLGSSCIYPKLAPQPMKEEYLLDGKLEPTNEPYALAKIAGIKLCESYNRQYRTNFISCMPTNLYGPGDNYDPMNSHVIPGLIRRFHEFKTENKNEMVVWGTGTPKREFLFVDDLAEACLFLINNYCGNETINVGSGEEFTIKELAGIIKEVVGFKGVIKYDNSKPDGTPRKLLESTKIFNLGWRPTIRLRDGLKLAYDDFLERRTV